MILKSVRGNIWQVSECLVNEYYINIHLLENDDNKIIKIASIEDGPLFCEINFYIRYCKEEMVKDVNILPYVDSGIDKYKKLRFLVLPKLDYNLKQISINNIYNLSKDIIFALKYIHSKEYIHSDIKDENILYDKNNNKFYLTDFGNITKHTKKFITNCKLVNNGTYKYIGIDMHNGISTYKSDLESFGYLLYDILYGLPWNNKLDKDIINIKKDFIDNVIICNNKLSKYFLYLSLIENDKNIEYVTLLKTLE
ncbi:ORF MSV154 putative serine/threonine protein kinase VRK1 homolog (vaccinia B1R), similar to GB:AB000449 [Melanoplus sanguinipes entomopoxvirus]|uniref:non-specific serine/threonine protein kinase n=1 Tax=Melanoplus sanguinipes entomopoxvirus TaxID=83191 RepID=Q9YVT8_MSEPV|nr:ORF MSV154 putative serine/threonine protein kinase VRK1 homolog (vaccinia B1R), similar to GB:AB000449 [Melanoplus sanguinipes entomopoxvirus]AAC97783.1 ORF MSV154 putative serine/threonine protein kinase VRK1 homolog (vaccinia B1R), similar to GB:AB000449 [Melanoplus sanguinipes entomopoxvirus 'O']